MRVDYSMFEGFQVKGNARTVLSRGEVIVDNGEFLGKRRPRAISASARRAEEPGSSTGASELDIRDPRSTTKTSRPFRMDRRTWGIYNYASLWVAMSVCIPTYMLASGLIAGGMSWWQAIGTILLGNLIVLIPMLLNAHAGAKYGIPFPVFVRASFGVRGANIPAVLRALVACGWFGIQTWIGGQAIYSMLKILWPGAAQSPAASGSASSRSGLLNIAVIWRGIETIKFLEGIGAPFMLGVGLLLLWWITRKAGGFGPVLSAPSKFHTTGRVHALLHSVAHRHGGILGHRGAEHSRLHALRQIAEGADARPGARTARRHDALFVHRRGGDFGVGGAVRPSHLGPGGAAGRFNQPVVAFIALVALLVATLNTNVAANVVSPSNDFSNLNPRLHFVPHRRPDHRRGRRPDDALEAAERFQRLHFRLAGGLFGPAGPDRRHHDRGLFSGAPLAS